MIEINIRLYATLKDRAGRSTIKTSLPEPATVETLVQTLTREFPALSAGLPTAIVAVNRAFADNQTPICTGDEVAIFPPVSGGSDHFPHPVYFALTAEPFDLQAIHARLSAPDVGAIVTFSGFVRGETEREGLPPATIYLEYEA